jgi:hypothetical protein
VNAGRQAGHVFSVDGARALAQAKPAAEYLCAADFRFVDEAAQAIEPEEAALELRLGPDGVDGAGPVVDERAVGPIVAISLPVPHRARAGIGTRCSLISCHRDRSSQSTSTCDARVAGGRIMCMHDTSYGASREFDFDSPLLVWLM